MKTTSVHNEYYFEPYYVFPSVILALPLNHSAIYLLSYIYNFHDRGGYAANMKHLAKNTNYSYMTVVRAIKKLKQDGYLLEINDVFWINLDRFTKHQVDGLMHVLELTKNDRPEAAGQTKR